MNAREPLHQPPNARDLSRVAPASSECAVVRGMLRDFADLDLAAADVLVVEQHVHACRTCAIELARAEHETMRLRRTFASLRSGEPTLPADFAARVVERLVLDETSLVRPEALAAAVDGAAAAHALESTNGQAEIGRSGIGAAWLRRLAPMDLLFAATLLLVVIVGSIHLLDGGSGGPEHVARLVVVAAHGLADGEGRPLGVPSGLGESQGLRVGRGGEARVDWHDLSTKVQPAASLAMHGAGEVRMVDGRPLLVNGILEVTTNRQVSIPIADGSRLDLGIGQYLLAAEPPDLLAYNLPPSGQSVFASSPADLFVKVEVRRGESAMVVRSGGSIEVKAGQVGVYQGSAPFVPGSNGSDFGSPEVIRVGATLPPAPTLSLSGLVLDPSGHPSLGAEVRLSFGSLGSVQNLSKVSAFDGSFSVSLDRACDTDFAVALAFASGTRSDLGMVAPNAWPLARTGPSMRLLSPISLGFSVPVVGAVRDDLGVPRVGVTVVPCIVDELFGHVMALLQFRTQTEAGGAYRIERLPSVLPPHQTLVLLLSHGSLQPKVVPVPQRGSVLAGEWMPPIVMAHLRTVQLHMFAALTPVQIYEEIDGLPAGSAAWRHAATTDASGLVSSLKVGNGRLWLRGGSASTPMLRELVMDEVAPLPQFRPANELPRQFGSVFRSLQSIQDTGLEITNSYRHQRFSVSAAVESSGGQFGRAVDSAGRRVAMAQVFAVGATGPRGSVDTRFLGFSAADGSFSCSGLDANSDLLLVGEDGSVGMVARPLGTAAVINVPMQSGGRVRLDETLRGSSPNQGFVTIRFQRASPSLEGMEPVATRFVSAATSWEIVDVPPGDYIVTIDSVVLHANVPASGTLLLH